MTKLIRRASAEARAFDRQPGDSRGRRVQPEKAYARAVQLDDEAAPEAAPRSNKNAGKPRFEPVTFSEEHGVRYLHFGTPWVQGAMRLKHPWRLELDYAKQMMAWLLFVANPPLIVQLGLGTASLTKFCYKRCPGAEVMAVELNPAVVVAAHTMFGLPPDDERLSVLEMNAWDFVNDASKRGSVGVLQVDLYDATASGPVLDSVAFYRACRACLTSPGMMTVNLFGDHPSFEKNMRHLRAAFDGRVLALPEVHEGNRIALAFAGPPLDFPWERLEQRALDLQRDFKLPAGAWVEILAELRPGTSFVV